MNTIFLLEYLKKTPFGRSMCRWENTAMDLRGIGSEGVHWIHLV
jgi:hypothetical protein